MSASKLQFPHASRCSTKPVWRPAKGKQPKYTRQLLQRDVSAAVVQDVAAATLHSTPAPVYATVAALAASFVGTFVVAPRFKKNFKEEDDWQTIYEELVRNGGVQGISAADASKRRGAVIVDVRLARKAELGKPSNSLNIPLYQPIQGWDIPSTIRRIGFAFFGIFGTERNPDFSEEVLARVPKNKEVILACEMGGSLENKSGTKWGFQSRSLKAAYYFQQMGYKKVLYLDGGVGAWVRAGLPLDYPEQGS
uniref:Rhodanese-like domain-containing protein chloroplastic-like n=1 Tax=Tetraselmis sp. GSL018 TaxID=582737 RepID=A0A061R0P2_9CHLO|mmetsp:Transcript_37598/g.89326  ORF Transcript_37598/g.89326 Transcript_37598/m.89326 type:complete len:251 (-) Transcript_37598:232-984(-)|eukprot:CAMPEP_0177609404 /NCGR_PEP_ID=MMETSP0419_2-20121207/19066_1 /TAXON_ID=582737 /ORGANISM="Tetraselmis sp., Strain GSL018" /LENGTH=250 /DNA_ID=CAMNT_0019104317 /DNA_START=96 /DNA_END=848 /DNA_ORIENTATION=+